MKRHISYEPLNCKTKHVILLLAVRHCLIFLVISLHIRVILNNIFGVKYRFDVKFLIGHVYNKAKESKYCLIPYIIHHWVFSSIYKKKLRLIGMK